MLYLKTKLNYGIVSKRKDNMSIYTITGSNAVYEILILLKNHLKLKKDIAKLILKIIEDKRKIESIDDFIKVCELVDKTAEFNYSKNRKNTTLTVKKHNNLF